MRILLVEDDPEIGPKLATRLSADGFIVDLARCLGEAVEAVIGVRYRAVLLDRRLPDGEGLSLLPVLATRPERPPVLILSALDDIPDRVSGIEAGADDYLIKPFAYEELRARLLVRIRRTTQDPPAPPHVVGAMSYDLATREVRVHGRSMTRARRELALLDALVRKTGRVVLREQLEAEVYSYDDDIQSNALEAHVSRLRRRLTEAGAGIDLHAVWGVGYMLRPAS